jgi:glycosyltransferase involved in cell wall biosynthesis
LGDECGVADISVVPLGVDRTIFHEDIPATRLDGDFTVFVNVGKWEIRKGHDVLLNAFCKAFSRTDKVILKLLPYNMFIGPGNEAWAKMYMSSSMASRIQIHPYRVREQGEVARFIASGDCAVFPARAEAWNHELLEAMSCGLTCIATDYSGHTEYATGENCLLIDVEDVEPAIDHVWFHGQGNWAAFGRSQEEQLIEHMRSVHRLKQTGELLPNKEGVATATHLSWERSATKLAESIT